MAVTNKNLVEQYARLHRDTHYQKHGWSRFAPLADLAVLELNAKTVLDYGCGGGVLLRHLAQLPGVSVYGYDPAVPEYATMPIKNADIVLCTDVMEHIPECDVNDVLSDIREISKFAFFNIALVPPRNKACPNLPDGSPLHCTLRSAEWWQDKIMEHFDNVGYTLTGKRGRSVVIVTFTPRAPKLFDYVAQRVMFGYRLPFSYKIRQKLAGITDYFVFRNE